jgi:hypothetical protein
MSQDCSGDDSAGDSEEEEEEVSDSDSVTGDSEADSDTGDTGNITGDLKWRQNLVQKAALSVYRTQKTAASLRKLVYGRCELCLCQ